MQQIVHFLNSSWFSSSQSNFWKRFEEYCTRGNAVNEVGRERTTALNRVVKELAAKSLAYEGIVLQRKDAMPLHHIAEALYEDQLNQKIYISYLLLFEPEDLPLALKPLGIDDPRLVQNEYLDSVLDWMQSFLGTEPLPKEDAARTNAQLLVLLLRNPARYKLAQKFLLAHEISHLIYRHGKKNHELATRDAYIAKSAAAIAAACGWGVARALSVGCIGTIALAGLSALAVNYVTGNLLYRKREHATEYEADLSAVTRCGADVEGALYFFETSRLVQKLQKQRCCGLVHKVISAVNIDNAGDFRLPPSSHPRYLAREARLKALDNREQAIRSTKSDIF